MGPQKKFFGVFFSMWKMRYHENYRKTKSKHHPEQWTTHLNPFPLELLQNPFSYIKRHSKTEHKERDFGSLKPFLVV